jgi:hypothetical protein
MCQKFDEVFELYVDDNRYSVPTLRFVAATNPARVWAVASQLLNESQHHIGVEIRVADRRVGGLGTYTTSSGGSPPRSTTSALGTRNNE